MPTRVGDHLAVVAVGIIAVLISAFLWVIGLILGSPFMASPPTREGVIGGAVLRVVAVLMWGFPVVVAWQRLGRRAARTTAVVMGSCLVAALALVAVVGVW